MTIRISLSKRGKYGGQFEAIVDEIDADLAAFDWLVIGPKGRTQYAARHPGSRKHRENHILHRIVMERILGRPLEQGEVVDHIDCDGLNNRRSNLRLANRSQNQMNKVKAKHNSSGYKGVSWSRSHKKWQAAIRISGKTVFLGRYADPAEAHKAYCEAAKLYFGEFANCGDKAGDNE